MSTEEHWQVGLEAGGRNVYLDPEGEELEVASKSMDDAKVEKVRRMGN